MYVFVTQHRDIKFSRSFLDDEQWHHVCISWNGVSGVTLVYVDGVRDNSVRGDPFRNPDGLLQDTIEGGGSLSLLSQYSQTIYLTEFNLWDKVLTAQEIEEASKSCVGTPGNVKRWFDFWPGFKATQSKYDTPSTCESPRDRAAGRNTEAGEEDAVAGKKNEYLKWKKQAVKKYTKKGL